jgi:outer membrane protein W
MISVLILTKKERRLLQSFARLPNTIWPLTVPVQATILIHLKTHHLMTSNPSWQGERMITRKRGSMARVVLIAAALFFVSVSSAIAQEMSLKDRWGAGLRAGAGMLTHEIASNVDGDLGPIVSGNIVYALEETLFLGINVEWETHAVDINNIGVGDATTISFIPFIEFHAAKMKFISPYVLFGMGVNLNSFDLSDSGSAVFNKFDPPTTVALKAGIGADYFFTQNMALNTEVGWKYNSGKIDACINLVGCTRDDWNVSVASILIGLRYFF